MRARPAAFNFMILEFSPKKCLMRFCWEPLFICRINKQGMRIALCETCWFIFDMADCFENIPNWSQNESR